MFLKNARRKLEIGLRRLSSNKSSQPDHYDTLKVPKSATQAEIKNAYFELSKQYHPDRVKATEENVTKFRNITEAYEVLGNVENRRVYDRGGTTSDLDFGMKYPEQAEEEEDPYQRYHAQKKRQEMGVTFDNWTAKHQNDMRERKAEMKWLHKEFKSQIGDSNLQKNNYPVLFASIFLFLLCWYGFNELLSVPSNSNAIERLLKNNVKKNDKDKR